MVRRLSYASFIALSLSLVVAFIATSTAQATVGPPVRQSVRRDDTTYLGCFSSVPNYSDQGPYTFQSSGWCKGVCSKQNQAVAALTSGSDCWCGNSAPPGSNKVDDSQCNVPCQGFNQEKCGGNSAFTVYATGLDPSMVGSSPPSSSSTSTTQSVVTSVAPGTTVIVTLPAAAIDATATPPASSSGGSNTAGIAAGVVVAIVAVAAISGGAFFFLRRRRQQQMKEELARQNQVSDFMSAKSHPDPPMSSWSQMSDQRLDPFSGRKNSVGSLADAQDYSRKILRVANPDHS